MLPKGAEQVGLVVHAEVVGDAVDVLWHAAALLLDVPIREHISEAGRDPERSVLGNTSISTLGLVELLTTWAFVGRARGAVMDPAVRPHARQLLERVIGAALCRG